MVDQKTRTLSPARETVNKHWVWIIITIIEITIINNAGD